MDKPTTTDPYHEAEGFIISPNHYHLVTTATSSNCNCNSLEQQLRHRWDAAMLSGTVFRYSLDDDTQRRRILPGRIGFVAIFNAYRSTKRRQPQPFNRLLEPFSPHQFNFGKAERAERLLTTKSPDTSDQQKLSPTIISSAVLVNVSPMAAYHMLIATSIDACLPQSVTRQSIDAALAILLSVGVGWRAGFNSLLAYASINHLHWHLWFESERLPTERYPLAPLDPAESSDCCYQTDTTIPYRGFCFVLVDLASTKRFVDRVFLTAQCLIESGVPYTLFLTRSRQEASSIRAYVWARRSVSNGKIESSDAGAPPFNSACAEFGGNLIVMSRDALEISEIDAARRLGAECNQAFDSCLPLVVGALRKASLL